MKHPRSFWVVLVVSLLVLRPTACLQDEEQFAEEAAISSIPSGHTLVHLHFTLTSPARRHYTLLPKAIGQLVAGVPFEEVELALTQGRWHYDTWGLPLLPAKPSGAELRAAFHPRVPAAELPLLWGNLSHSLSGMFCASLNFLARPETTALQSIEFGENDSSSSNGSSSSSSRNDAARSDLWARPAVLNRLYAALPKEAVCTENLTPALKLLPCRDQAGVASLLLHRPTVFSADYNSLRVHISTNRAPGDGRLISTRLSFSITLVLRPPSVPGVASAGARLSPKPRTYSSWRLGSLMGTPLRGACPAATSSRLLVQLPPQLARGEGSSELLQPPPPPPPPPAAAAGDDNADESGTAGAAAPAAAADVEEEGTGVPVDWTTQAFVLSPAPDGVIRGDSSSGSSSSSSLLAPVFYWWDLQVAEQEARRRERRRQATTTAAAAAASGPARLEFAQEWRVHTVKGAVVTTRPELSVVRYTTGRGFMHGGIVLRLSAVAPLPAQGSPAAAAGVFPPNRTICIFQLVPWYVRLWLHTLQLTVDGVPADLDTAISLRHISPASDRTAPLVLDLCLDLPEGASEVRMSAEYSKAFLHVFEWPPDAHRGFDVPAAVVTYPRGRAAAVAAGGGGEWIWRSSSGVAEGNKQQQQEQQQEQNVEMASPLLAALSAAAGVEALYGDALLVQLAPPDFSMPYNVVCLTSTVLAIYIGATLNALLRRPGQELRDAAKGAVAARAAAKQKAIKVVAVVGVFGGLALYVDEELRVQLARALVDFGIIRPDAFGGLGRPAPPGAH